MVVPLLLAGQSASSRDAGTINRIRKMRNKYMHEGALHLQKGELSAFYESTRRYIDVLVAVQAERAVG